MTAAACASVLAAMTISVTTDPPLPAPNLLPTELRNFATNVFTKEKKSVYRNVGKIVKPGHAYILACEIRPSAEVSTRGVAGSAGLGAVLAYWDKDWKRGISISAKGEGPDRWQRIVSEPVTMPDWISPGQLTVGLSYTEGHGRVRNVELTEAGCELVVDVRAEKGVAQVKVVDENLRTVFDTLVLPTRETAWSGRVRADTAHRYSVYAVDFEGDVSVESYSSRGK